MNLTGRVTENVRCPRKSVAAECGMRHAASCATATTPGERHCVFPLAWSRSVFPLAADRHCVFPLEAADHATSVRRARECDGIGFDGCCC